MPRDVNPMWRCDCGWIGFERELDHYSAADGLWAQCPQCGNNTDDMEEISETSDYSAGETAHD